MKFLVFNPRHVLLLVLVLAGFALGGCATAESDNMSERPWNSPQGWETGMPSGMYNQYK
jgi:hypothetical protein